MPSESDTARQGGLALGPVAPLTMAVPPVPPMIGVGDIVPMFLLPMVAPGDLPFVNGLFGRVWLMFIYECDANPQSMAILRALRDEHARLTAMGVCILALSKDHWESHRQTAGRHGIPFPLLSDPAGITHGKTGYSSLTKTMGPAFAGMTLVIDSLFHVAAVCRDADPAAHVAKAVASVEQVLRARPPAEPIYGHAPVLLLRNIFEPEFCQYLIRHFDTYGGGDSGFMVTGPDGKTVGKYDYGKKIRSDHFIQDAEVKKAIDWRIGYRLRPEIRKAFNFNASRREDLKIICYDSKTGGFFRPHRDNTSPSTSHRRWALTVNLNTEEHTGGALRFPEFGPLLYQPRSGDAVVFSCSLLHEVTDIIAGRRLAMTTFIHGEEEMSKIVPLEDKPAIRGGTRLVFDCLCTLLGDGPQRPPRRVGAAALAERRWCNPRRQ